MGTKRFLGTNKRFIERIGYSQYEIDLAFYGDSNDFAISFCVYNDREEEIVEGWFKKDGCFDIHNFQCWHGCDRHDCLLFVKIFDRCQEIFEKEING